MHKVELLKNLGLSKQEVKVYLSLIEYGSSLISHIGRSTNLHRPTIYQAISNLLKKGLVSVEPKGKQKFYLAEPPEKLQFIFDSFKKEFEGILPGLKEVYENHGKWPVVNFLEGRQGITAVLEDILQTLKRGDTYYRYSSHQVVLAVEKYLPPKFRERRQAKQIQRYVITDALAEWQKKPDMNRSYKVVPEGSILLNKDILQAIYGDKVSFGDLRNETGVIIESAAFAELQRNIFKTLYAKL